MATEKILITKQYLQDTADSIRTKLNTNDTFKTSEFASKIDEMNIAAPVEKGLIVNEWDENGYATDVSVVGFTEIPKEYFYNAIPEAAVAKNFLSVDGDHLHLPQDLEKIGERAFYGCKGLTSLNLPNTLTTIGVEAFVSCSNLNFTQLPSNLKTISKDAFKECTSLTISELPESATSIGMSAFYNCNKMPLTKLPNAITSISQSAFEYCSELALTELPSNLNNIGISAFFNCKKLAITELPQTLKSIGDSGLRGCPLLKITRIPATVLTLNNYVFYLDTGLEEITFEGTTNITGVYTFGSCSNLKKVAMPNVTKVVTLGSNVFKGTPIASGTGYIYVPDTLVDSFKAATNWSTYADQIKPISEMEETE